MSRKPHDTPTAPAMDSAAAVWLPLSALRPNPRNPRAHGAEVQRLARTIVRTTWGAPIIAQASTHRIIGGHGRLEAARLIMAGIEVDGIARGGAGHRFDRSAPAPGLVPVRLVDVSDAEADAMTLADNAVALQGHDDAAAVVAMATAAFERDAPTMADMGYAAADLDALVKSAGDAVLAAAAGGASDGDVERHEIIGALDGDDPGAEEPPPDAPVFSRAGEVYELGPHRLVCGDSRDAAVWARLMGDTRANVVFTSPPYASQRKYDESSGFKPIPPDEYVAWWEPLQACVREHIAADGSFFVNIKEHCDDGQRHLYVKDLTIAHVRLWGWRFVDEFCWKRKGVPGGWDYRFKNEWEPVFHFSRATPKCSKFAVGTAGITFTATDNAAAKSVAGQSVFNCNGANGKVEHAGLVLPGNVIEANGATEADHNAAFPIGLPEFFIKAFSDAGDVIVDPFLGSGSTLIASAKNARECRGFEISPRYCDVIRRRWTKFARSAGVDPGPGALD
jgi:DNA modification methylase